MRAKMRLRTSCPDHFLRTKIKPLYVPLEAVTTAVLELEGGRSLSFSGPWDAWRREKAARVLAATKAADRIGRDIERVVLARAVKWHLEDRVVVHENRTFVFV